LANGQELRAKRQQLSAESQRPKAVAYMAIYLAVILQTKWHSNEIRQRGMSEGWANDKRRWSENKKPDKI